MIFKIINPIENTNINELIWLSLWRTKKPTSRMIIDTVSYFWINNLLLKEDNPGYLTILPSFKDF